VPQAAAIEPNWRMIGENIGVGGAVDDLHESFVRSPAHRANMFGAYNRVGVGVLLQGSKLWVTVDFLNGPQIGGATATEYAYPIVPAPAGRVPTVVPVSSRD